MATHEAQLKRRLGRVRRRWRLTAAFRGGLLVVTEALGAFLVILLADAIYNFSGKVLLGLWAVAAAVLAVLFARHVLYPLWRRIGDEQTALLIEERAEQAKGAVISAVECTGDARGRAPGAKGLYGFLVNFLVDDAVARIDRTPLRVVSNLRRLRKHLVLGLVLLAVFVATTLTYPKWRGEESGLVGVLTPWLRIQAETEREREAREERDALHARLFGPIGFEVAPGDVRLLRGSGLRVTVKLSRTPPETPVLVCRTEGGGEEGLSMAEIQSVDSYSIDLTDINEDMTYEIAIARQRSLSYRIDVYDRLAISGLGLTYHYPGYLDLEPLTRFGMDGDISVPSGTKVDLKVVANNPLKSGRIVFDEKDSRPLKPGPKAADGASISFPVTADSTYSLTVSDIYGDTVRSDQFFFVKAVPDEPPTVELAAPRVDMSVHPLCEVTFRAKVTDDFGIKDAVVKAKTYRGEKVTPVDFAMKLSDEAGRTKNVKDGTAEYVWQLESAKPQVKPGDMVFYHIEAGDRKGHTVKTDVFYVKLWPLEVAATWPDSVAPPDLPHETFNDPMDLMLFLAAAWHLEQQRGEIPEGEFNAKSEKIAQRMEVGDPPDFSTFWGHGGAPPSGPNSGPILAAATKHIETGHGLLKFKHEPGKAADHMRVALAMVETLASDKRVLALELNPEPIHTGQPSSGHADDPVMEQIAFRIPSVMSDSITAFQQPDNPPRLLPPDYRRALRIKERKGFRVKQLRMVGEIYATEEQLVEMAREQLGHIQLREAIDDNTPNDPAQSGSGGGEEVRIDKRAIPYKELVTADERRAHVARADRQTLSEPKVDRIKDPLKYGRVPDNRRRGGPNPYTTQAPGGGGGEQDPEDQQRPQRLDEESLRRMRERIMARRPPQSGGGGGSGDPQGMQMPGEQAPGQSSAGGQAAMQQMAQWQRQLAMAAGQVARDVARSMEPGDSMSRQAVSGMRDASAAMQRAAESFRRGDVRRGISQARRAQGMLRSAINRLKASQYDSLEQAVVAAQDGAAALAANQYRIAQGTGQIARRVGEITGEPGKAQPGTGQPGQAQPGQAQPGQAQPGQAQPGQAQPGQAQPGQAQPGQAQPGQAQPGTGQPGQAQPGTGRVGAPSRQAVEKAAASDPRIGPQLKGLAADQGKLAKDMSEFMSYVGDLKKWADDAAKGRVAGSLGDVNKNLTRDGTPQKMVDAAIGLAGRDLQSAMAAQQQVERSLGKMVAGVQEAAEILAGSPTGILRRAARDAREVGEGVAAIAARGGPQQPGTGQPGQGQPGQGQPGQGQPGQAQPGQAQPGQGQPGPAQPGQGQPGQGQPGQAQPGQGQPGKGPDEPDLAQRLAGQQPGTPGQTSPSGTPSAGGGGAGSNQDIGELYLKTRRLTQTLSREQLADEQAIRFMKRRSADINTFRKMFDRARKAEAMKFSQVALGVGASLEEALKEALSAKRLHAEQREECPPKYREFVNAYFEALSKAARSPSRP